MYRRNFISSVFAASSCFLLAKSPLLASKRRDSIKGEVLKSGDIVGVIAPGTAVSDPNDLLRVKEALDYFGLKMELGKYVKEGSGYKTRSIDQRLDDLHAMFANKEIKAVFCIRGGYGSMQLLDKIDYDLIGNNPKVFLGYSDITALHIAINKLSGLITFHGPVMLSGFTDYTAKHLRKALFSDEPIGRLANPDVKNGIRSRYPVRTVVPGLAAGRLIGGNLSLISNTLGTPYEIDTDGKILFIEDVGEEPYRIDRMLTQLRLSGKLDAAAGIIFGKCTDCKLKSPMWDPSIGEVVDNILGRLKMPVLSGLMIGHSSNQMTIPEGAAAELNADEGYLDIIESALVRK